MLTLNQFYLLTWCVPTNCREAEAEGWHSMFVWISLHLSFCFSTFYFNSPLLLPFPLPTPKIRYSKLPKNNSSLLLSTKLQASNNIWLITVKVREISFQTCTNGNLRHSACATNHRLILNFIKTVKSTLVCFGSSCINACA